MHPDREILSAFLDGEVESPWKEEVSGHLAGCASCRALLSRMEATRHLLLGEEVPDHRGPMERIRERIISGDYARPPAIPFWRRSITVSMPVLGAAFSLVLLMAFSLVLALFRLNIGTVHITRAPAGATEIRIAAPVKNLESLLKSFETQDSGQDVIRIPKDYRLSTAGEPLMGTEADFLRKKTW